MSDVTQLLVDDEVDSQQLSQCCKELIAKMTSNNCYGDNKWILDSCDGIKHAYRPMCSRHNREIESVLQFAINLRHYNVLETVTDQLMGKLYKVAAPCLSLNIYPLLFTDHWDKSTRVLQKLADCKAISCAESLGVNLCDAIDHSALNNQTIRAMQALVRYNVHQLKTNAAVRQQMSKPFIKAVELLGVKSYAKSWVDQQIVYVPGIVELLLGTGEGESKQLKIAQDIVAAFGKKALPGTAMLNTLLIRAAAADQIPVVKFILKNLSAIDFSALLQTENFEVIDLVCKQADKLIPRHKLQSYVAQLALGGDLSSSVSFLYDLLAARLIAERQKWEGYKVICKTLVAEYNCAWIDSFLAMVNSPIDYEKLKFEEDITARTHTFFIMYLLKYAAHEVQHKPAIMLSLFNNTHARKLIDDVAIGVKNPILDFQAGPVSKHRALGMEVVAKAKQQPLLQ